MDKISNSVHKTSVIIFFFNLNQNHKKSLFYLNDEIFWLCIWLYPVALEEKQLKSLLDKKKKKPF